MGTLATTITSKGQVTIPKHIRDAMKLKPGKKLVFDVNKDGELVLKPFRAVRSEKPEWLARVIGSADVKWPGGTDAYMKFIRGEDE